MKEKLIAYGRFDCKNESGYTEMLALVEYEDHSTTCFGRYLGFQIYETPREIRREG